MHSSSEKGTVYTGYKIAKVRWKPLPPDSLGKSNTLATGSFEDEENRVSMWTLPEEDEEDVMEKDRLVPVLSCDLTLPAGVTDMCFIDERFLLVSLEDGSLQMLKYMEAAKTLKQAQVWDRLHSLPIGQPAPCTALTVCDEGGVVKSGASGAVTVVTGGEDGRIVVLHSDDMQPFRVLEHADSSTVTGLLCSLQLEVLSTSSSGQLKIWDLRSNSDRPVNYVLVPGELTSMESLARHPHQPHVIAIGRGDGSVCLKDLRQPKHSLQLLQAHSAEVWEVKFDSSHPNNLFTCSQDGSLWHWDVNDAAATAPPPKPRHPTSSLMTPYSLLSSSRLGTSTLQQSHAASLVESFSMDMHWNGGETSHASSSHASSPWLSDAVQQGKVNVQDYSPGQGISVNSLDVESQRLVCGTDGEALFLTPPLTLR